VHRQNPVCAEIIKFSSNASHGKHTGRNGFPFVPTDSDRKRPRCHHGRNPVLHRRGVIGEQDLYDPFSDENPLLAGMTAASVQGMIATGERAGLTVRRVLSDPARVPEYPLPGTWII
jgi:hypothetical protein